MSADPVLTLADLANWSRPGTSLAVLGHPIGHSLSPLMHNAALAELARTDAAFEAWRYFRFEIHPDDLTRALTLLHTKNFRGVNLTVPHKIIAFGHVAPIDAAARPAGAVNTLLREEHGWRGFNTDGYGLATAVREAFGRELTGSHVILLGAGGAARGGAAECLQRRCASLNLLNRTRDNLGRLLAALAPIQGGIPVRGLTFSELAAAKATTGADLPAEALIINATSSGLLEADEPPLELAEIPRPAAVFDMIYNPPQTPLLRRAADLGIPGSNGLGMLVHQGAKALEIWSGVPAAQTASTMAAALHAGPGPRGG